MKIKQMTSLIRRAIEDYNMIQEGDNIAIGISGGKDSLTLLYALSSLQAYYPEKFKLYAVTGDLGFGNLNLNEIRQLCQKLNVEYHVVETDIGKIVFEDRKESNPCSLCAKLRKGALNQAMKELGCNKIAYAHHRDDVISTMFLSMLYEGRMHTFQPVTYLERMDLTVIRPMIYVKEADVKGFVNKYELPVVKSPCPADKHTKREYVNQLLQQLNRENPGVKDRIFTAIRTGGFEGWGRWE